MTRLCYLHIALAKPWPWIISVHWVPLFCSRVSTAVVYSPCLSPVHGGIAELHCPSRSGPRDSAGNMVLRCLLLFLYAQVLSSLVSPLDLSDLSSILGQELLLFVINVSELPIFPLLVGSASRFLNQVTSFILHVYCLVFGEPWQYSAASNIVMMAVAMTPRTIGVAYIVCWIAHSLRILIDVFPYG